jgi:hypothetical protein
MKNFNPISIMPSVEEDLTLSFWDVEGVPVKLWKPESGGLSCMAFDTDPPRRFSMGSLDRNRSRMSKEEFDKMVESIRSKKS